MLLRRARILLGAIGILGASLIGTTTVVSAAPVAEKALVVTITTGSSDFMTMSGDCEIPSHGMVGWYKCHTIPVVATWYQNGQIIAFDDIVIGTDYGIYHNWGAGWDRLNNGWANSTITNNSVGVHPLNPPNLLMLGGVQVIGTDHRFWCSFTNYPGSWLPWVQC